MPSCSVILLTAQKSEDAWPWLPVEYESTNQSPLRPRLSHLSMGILVAGSQEVTWLRPPDLRGSRLERHMLPCLPDRALSSSLPPLEGKLPINERELQTQHLAPRPRSLGEQGGSKRDGRGIGNKCTGVFSLVDLRSPPHPLFLPLSQIWTFTETDFMPRFPMNSLNSIEEPLSVPSVISCFHSLGETCGGEGWVLLSYAGGGWDGGQWGALG